MLLLISFNKIFRVLSFNFVFESNKQKNEFSLDFEFVIILNLYMLLLISFNNFFFEFWVWILHLNPTNKKINLVWICYYSKSVFAVINQF